MDQTPPPAEPQPGTGFGLGAALLFGTTVFTSAFLLFQVQPLIARYILPWFGASPGVWATCLLFFQVVLLLGYGYAHLLVTHLSVSRQAWVHGALLLLAAVTLPITPDAALKPVDPSHPTGRILLVLATSVGLPYLLLASTGPLLQGWIARLRPDKSPYRFYALSNVGSLLALLTYPFLFEPELRLEQQTIGWSVAYGLFAVLCGVCAFRLRRDHARQPRTEPEGPGPAWTTMGLWLLLSAGASALLLATTNQLCQDVASVPFLWIVPLCLYLLSFILTFDSDRWYVRPVVWALLALTLTQVVRALGRGADLAIEKQVLVFCAALFFVCMGCHGELARRRPAARHLTTFYLVIALGGALGGAFVALFAPVWFTGFYEYPLLLVGTVALLGVITLVDVLQTAPAPASVWAHLARGTCALLVCLAAVGGIVQLLDPSVWLVTTDREAEYERYAAWMSRIRIFAILGFLASLVLLDAWRWRVGAAFGTWWRRHAVLGIVAGCGVIGLVALVAGLGWIAAEDTRYLRQARNFYGVLRIRESTQQTGRSRRTLYNGRIDHGFQYIEEPTWAVSYYGPASGLGWAIRRHPQRATPARPFRMGVVGLGTGIVAAYANATFHLLAPADGYATKRDRRPGDHISFYEINPLVEAWAREDFQYLADAEARGATVDVLLGDARIVLERQAAQGHLQGFDVLAVDAFTGDAIPLHLLTKESFELYFRHLKPDGILAIHVSNLYLDLVPIVRRLGEELGKGVVYIINDDDITRGVDASDWVLVTNNVRFQQLASLQTIRHKLPPPGPLWTDDFSSLFDVLGDLPELENEARWEELPGDEDEDDRAADDR